MEKYINASVFYHGKFIKGSFEVSKGRFQNICPDSTGCNSCVRYNTDSCNKENIIDLENALVLPGLIDLHQHGNSGFDFSDCDIHGLTKAAEYLGKNGITAFTAAAVTTEYSQFARSFAIAKKLYDLQNEKGPDKMSRICGVRMEGPYFSLGKRGAQNPRYLKNPDFPGFMKLFEECKGLIKIVDIAPELEGAMEFIRKASRICKVSVAHTEADYETVLNAFSAGAVQVTHLFNGMNELLHRAPGPVGAAFDTPDVFVELICDGIHVLPPVIRMVFQLFPGRVILISDALACCGMPDGHYTLGNQDIILKDRHASLSDNTLAGSACNLFDMLRNAVSFGISPEEAIAAASWNPARQLGLEKELGSIENGKKADFLICTKEFRLKAVYIEGNPIR